MQSLTNSIYATCVSLFDSNTILIVDNFMNNAVWSDYIADAVIDVQGFVYSELIGDIVGGIVLGKGGKGEG